MKLPFFGKKESVSETDGRGYLPTDRAMELMSRGFSEIDTIDVLRREGFSPDEIDSALEEAIRRGTVGMAQQQPAPVAAPESYGYPSLGQTYEQYQEPRPVFPPRREQTQPQPSPPQPADITSPDFNLPTIEEISSKSQADVLTVPETSLPEEYYQGYPTEEYIDYVVQEHMQEFDKKLSEFSVLYKDMEKRFIEMNERLKESSKIRSAGQQQVINKMDNLNETVGDLNMKISGLEKAFKDTLPALIESVRALSDIVQRMKRES